MSYKKELSTALDAAKKAGKYLNENREKVFEKYYKEGTYNYATKQDLVSNEIIIDNIKKEFPNDFILSEETSVSVEKLPERMWIIDPIDGTRNYANGLSYFSISIAFAIKGDIKVGVVYAPSNNDELFHAVKSEGVFLNGKKLSMLNQNQGFDAAVIATGFAYFKGDALMKELGIYGRVLDKCTDVVRLGSAALDLCNVAAGRLGGYYEKGLKPWDIAAGKLILEEQGGILTDYTGKNLDIYKKVQDKFAVDIVAVKNDSIKASLITILKS